MPLFLYPISSSNADDEDDGREDLSPYDAPQRSPPSERARSSEKCVRCLPCAEVHSRDSIQRLLEETIAGVWENQSDQRYRALIEESLVKDTLKLAYVALSRPRYYAGVAMHKENVSDETILVAARHGWRIVKVEEAYESLSEELSHLTL
jgi:hypothetical protein